MIGYLAAFQVILITECNAFLGQGIIGGGRGTGERMGGFFDSFLGGIGGPTAASLADPFSGGFGMGNSMMGILPYMAADIDFADQMSARADARAAKQEAMQAANEGAGTSGREGQIRGNKGQLRQRQGWRNNQNNKLGQRSQFSRQWEAPPTQDPFVQGEYPETTPIPYTGNQGAETFQTQRHQGQTKWIFRQTPIMPRPAIQTSNETLKHPNTTPKTKRSLGPHNQQEMNKQRLAQIFSSSGTQVFKDSANNAAVNQDFPISKKSKHYNNNLESRSRLDRRRPRKPTRMDPDLMSDMMDMAGDMGLAGMMMNPISRRAGRCDLSSIRTLMEYMITGKMCGGSTFNMRFGLGRR